ncbi:MAG: efflux RND transporter periplasmic adaptor subunit [Rhizobiaceae bacterium]|nr:efflux RND transporter periplasmic adaptor subunit [Rhizobiaceae bacterium]
MAFWKQLLVSLVVLLVAAGLWVRFFPGAPALLASWGIDWIPVATAKTPPQGVTAGNGPRQGGGAREGRAAPLVLAEPVRIATINDRLSAIGTGRANNSVVVTPFASGRLVEVTVVSGATVEAGEAIARLDSEGEEIALDRAGIALIDARAKQERIAALRTTNTASAVQATEAELAVRNAELAQRDAELALGRRTIYAPIAGIVGIIPVSIGNYVTSQTEIATIDDRSRILVDFSVPERFSGAIAVGSALEASSAARPGEVYAGVVKAIDNRIDAASRTLRVQAEITNPRDTLRAGMSFRVEMRFPGDSYPAVNPLAIQWGTDGAFIWTVDGGLAKRVPVRIIQRNTDSVLVEAPIAEGLMVVTEGIHVVREGAPVSIAGDTPPAVSEVEPSARPAPSGT